MKIACRLLICGATVALIGVMPSTVCAEDFYPAESDHPFRLFSYGAHAYGKAWEYLVLRPVHWTVSQPKLRYVFGKSSNPKTEDYWGDADLYQRYQY